MKKIALVALFLALPSSAFAINTRQLEGIPLPGVTTPLEHHRDPHFEEEYKKLPHAFNFLKEILRNDARSGRLSMRWVMR
jgi:hypothetical protein